MLEWPIRLLNINFDLEVVPMDRRGACKVPLYKEKSDKCECSNSRSISLLSVVSKLYYRVLIKRVRAMWVQAGYRMHGPSVCHKSCV